METTKAQSRSIAFRIWDVRQKRMMPWDEVWHSMVDMNFPDGKKLSVGLLSIALLDQSGRKVIAQQCSGLKDRKGVDIYEGDIFTFKRLAERPRPHFIQQNTVVEFREGQFGFVLNGFNDMFVDLYGDVRFGEVEIIGNIFENPELCPPSKNASKEPAPKQS